MFLCCKNLFATQMKDYARFGDFSEQCSLVGMISALALTPLHPWYLGVADTVLLLHRRNRFVGLSSSPVHSLNPQCSICFVFCGKRHIVAFLHQVEKVTTTLQIWTSYKDIYHDMCIYFTIIIYITKNTTRSSQTTKCAPQFIIRGTSQFPLNLHKLI